MTNLTLLTNLVVCENELNLNLFFNMILKLFKIYHSHYRITSHQHS